MWKGNGRFFWLLVWVCKRHALYKGEGFRRWSMIEHFKKFLGRGNTMWVCTLDNPCVYVSVKAHTYEVKCFYQFFFISWNFTKLLSIRWKTVKILVNTEKKNETLSNQWYYSISQFVVLYFCIILLSEISFIIFYSNTILLASKI